MARKKKTTSDLDVEEQDVSEIVYALTDNVKEQFKGDNDIGIGVMSDVYDDIMPKGYISTGDDVLDLIISNRKDGGLPLSKFINIYGDSSTGKSLIVAVIMHQVQKAGGFAVYFDTERAAFPPFMEVLGVDPKKTIYVPKAKAIERIFATIVNVIINNKKINRDKPVVIAVDSMTATNIESVVDDLDNFGESGYQGGAKRQKVIGENFQKVLDFIKEENVMFITVDQVRDNLNKKNMYDPDKRDTAGNAQRFYSDIRLELNLSSKIKDKKTKEVIGHKVRVKTVKNRIAPSPRSCYIYVYKTRGLDNYASWIENGKEIGIFKNTAGGLKYERPDGEVFRKEDGKMPSEVEFKQLLRTNKILRDEVYEYFIDQFVVAYERKGEDYFDDIDLDTVIEEVNEKGIEESLGDTDASSDLED